MYGQRPMSYGATYCEAEREVVRSPCDSYSSEYKVQEYATPGYNHNHHHNHNGGYADRVTEVVSYESIPSHHHHHHGGVAEFVERQEVVYDPCRRMY